MRRCLLIAVLAGLALAATAEAQTPPRPAAPPPPQATLTQLHDALRLSVDQEHQWSDYLASLRPTAETEARHAEAARLLPRLATPRRIALIEANQAQDQADFVRHGQAVVAFYAGLTAEQQAIFDRQTAPQGARGPADDAAPPQRSLRMPPPAP